MPLPKFVWPTQCPKCIESVELKRQYFPPLGGDTGYVTIVCKECGYRWNMEPADGI